MSLATVFLSWDSTLLPSTDLAGEPGLSTRPPLPSRVRALRVSLLSRRRLLEVRLGSEAVQPMFLPGLLLRTMQVPAGALRQSVLVHRKLTLPWFPFSVTLAARVQPPLLTPTVFRHWGETADGATLSPLLVSVVSCLWRKVSRENDLPEFTRLLRRSWTFHPDEFSCSVIHSKSCFICLCSLFYWMSLEQFD